MVPRSQTALLVAGGAAAGAAVMYALMRPAASTLEKPKLKGTDAAKGGPAIRFSKPKLLDFVKSCLCKAGASEANAALVADVLIYADCRGIPSHGCNRADFYAGEIGKGLIDANAVPQVVEDSGCCGVVDGKNGLGAVVSKVAIELAIAKAEAHGVGIVACRRSNHFGAAGYWAQQALDRGLIGFAFTNTAPYMVPTGGTCRAVGTNPICAYFPGEGGDCFQLDMATTTVPIGKIEIMDRLQKALPMGWGVDRHGEPCADPAEVGTGGGLCPLGGSAETAGYKGYGLGVLVELLSSALSGAAVGPDVVRWNLNRTEELNLGHCFIVIDPKRFAPGVAARLAAYLAKMRDLPGSVKVPGDPERAAEADAKAGGVLIQNAVAVSLKVLALEGGVDLLPELVDLDIKNRRQSIRAREK